MHVFFQLIFKACSCHLYVRGDQSLLYPVVNMPYMSQRVQLMPSQAELRSEISKIKYVSLDKYFTEECLCYFMCNSSVILGSHCECLVTSYPLCMIQLVLIKTIVMEYSECICVLLCQSAVPFIAGLPSQQSQLWDECILTLGQSAASGRGHIAQIHLC